MVSRKNWVEEFFQNVQEEVIEPSVEEEGWNFREISNYKWYEKALVGEGRRGNLNLEADMDGYIFLLYETKPEISEEIKEAAEYLETGINNQNSELRNTTIDHKRMTVIFDVDKDLDEYNEKTIRYLRDFVHLADHYDKSI